MLETNGDQHVPNRPAVKSVIEPTHVKVNVPACRTAASATKDGAFAFMIGRQAPPLSYEKVNHHRSLKTSLQCWINGFVALMLVLSALCAFSHCFADVPNQLEDDDNLGIQVPQSGATTHNTTLGTFGDGAKHNENGVTPPRTYSSKSNTVPAPSTEKVKAVPVPEKADGITHVASGFAGILHHVAEKVNLRYRNKIKRGIVSRVLGIL
jgi:hypothetical protein